MNTGFPFALYIWLVWAVSVFPQAETRYSAQGPASRPVPGSDDEETEQEVPGRSRERGTGSGGDSWVQECCYGRPFKKNFNLLLGPGWYVDLHTQV